MEAPPKVREIDTELLDGRFDAVTRGYFSIKIRDLIPGAPLPFDIFFPALGGLGKELKMSKLLSKDQVYNSSFHEHLVCEDIDCVYIRNENEDAFFSYFDHYVRKSVLSSDTSPEEKSLLLYDNAENIVKKAFRERPTKSNVGMGRRLVENFAVHLAIDKVSAEALLSIFSKDYYTFSHSVQVALLGMSFCKFMGWSKEDVTDFGLGALFHDIGKSVIDDAILNKPAKLSAQEFEIIKSHTTMGYQQLRQAQVVSKPQLHVVLHHHEAMDGSGYPHSLKRYDIHKFARMARIVDCYDALTTNRVYKDALPPFLALQTMNDEMRNTFDLHFLEAFIGFLSTEVGERKEAQEKRLELRVGIPVTIQTGSDGIRQNTTLVGMESGKFLILQAPALKQIENLVPEGSRIIARYILSGTVYGFKSTVLGHTLHPLRLLFLSYPESIEDKNLRKSPRIECFLPVEARLADQTYLGVLTDLSLGGCKLVMKKANNASLPDSPINEKILIQTQLLGENKVETFQGSIRSASLEEGKVVLGIQFKNLSDEALKGLDQCIKSVLALIK